MADDQKTGENSGQEKGVARGEYTEKRSHVNVIAPVNHVAPEPVSPRPVEPAPPAPATEQTSNSSE